MTAISFKDTHKKKKKMCAVVIKLVFVEPQLIPHDEMCGETETQNISDSLIKGIILMDL